MPRLWCFLLASLSALSAGQGIDRIQTSDLRRDLTYLSSDALQGRLSLTPGSEAAIHWIEAEFKKAGLETSLQPVPLWEFQPNHEAGFLKIRHAGKDEVFRSPDASGQYPEKVDISGGVVFAGFGITAPELGYDDYQGIRAEGKIVIVFDHEPQETDPRSIFNGRGNTRYATIRVKALNAQAHGALAVLLAPEPNRKHPTNQERVAKIGNAAQNNTHIASEAIVGDELHIPYMSISDAVTAKLLGTPGDLQSQIDRTLTPASCDLPGTTVSLHMKNSVAHRKRSFNVAGLLEGGDPRLRAETVVISGHFDHNGAYGARIWHGADDNGSGMVGVVELARAFSSDATRPKRSILFIVFAAEERGLLGSYYYVQHPLRPLASTRAVVNFDMIGRNETPSRQTDGAIEIAPDTSNELNLIGTNYTPEYRETVEQANRRIGLRLNYKWDQEASLNIFFRSDQFPFALRGIPAVWWFTGFHPDYHHTTDTVDKINFAKMEEILKLAYLSAGQFSNETKTPAFNPRTQVQGIQ
jgi:hypothetical protein